LIENNLHKLEIIKDFGPEEFSADFTKFEAAKHLLQVSIEAMVEIADHIIARHRFRIAATSADSFRVLRENNHFSRVSTSA
jgi:uncharacterized protein YutE (UPF0331/DUF86 family)